MRMIEFTEENGVKLGERNYAKGARDSFSDDEAAEYIRLGWAKDAETGEQGERVPGAQRIKINPVTQKAG